MTGDYRQDLTAFLLWVALVLGAALLTLAGVIIRTFNRRQNESEDWQRKYADTTEEWRRNFAERLHLKLDAMATDSRRQLGMLTIEWRREADKLREMYHLLEVRVAALEEWRKHFGRDKEKES